MILWGETGLEEKHATDRSVVVCECDLCKIIGKFSYKSAKRNIKRNCGQYVCRMCSIKSDKSRQKISEKSKQMWKNNRGKLQKSIKERFADQELRDKISKNMKDKWNDSEYRELAMQKYKDPEHLSKMSENGKLQWQNEEYCKEARERSRKLWEDDEFRNKVMSRSAAGMNSEDYRAKMSEIIKEKWKDQEYKDKIVAYLKDRWHNDDEYRCRSLNHLKKIGEKANHLRKNDPEFANMLAKKRSEQPRISSLQRVLYSILDDLGVKYYEEGPECVFGPWVFDCVVPLADKKLLIECQGEYRHTLNGREDRDKSKVTYIERYHKDCEVKHIWEHEFSCRDKIVELIKYWVGIADLELIDFEFGDIDIRGIKSFECKDLLSKYHYLPNAGRGGIVFGAYLEDELIAVCVFSSLIRQNLSWDKDSTRELSRLCVHPRYQKKNFASWFVSRCIKFLDSKYKTIISYCDTTFNHDGAVYKSCNFRLDGEVKPDYWYVSGDGWVVHKKTLYNHAVSLGIKESEFAERFGYKRVFGDKKLRFVYDR